jgi:DNA-binding GntR family transcriptional regulator
MSPTESAPPLPPVPLRPADTPRSTADTVARYIRALIFHGHLRNGDRIRQDDLATQMGVSRIPVREAIIALDREGWVTSEPHRGAFVNGLDRGGIEDHYEMLGMLYGLVARRATERATAEDVERLTEQQRALKAADDPDDVLYENERLLRLMFKIADSPRLSAVSRVMTGVVPGNFFAEVPGAVQDQKRATARIVKAIAAGEADQATDEWQKLLHRHAHHVVALLSERDLFKVG